MATVNKYSTASPQSCPKISFVFLNPRGCTAGASKSQAGMRDRYEKGLSVADDLAGAFWDRETAEMEGERRQTQYASERNKSLGFHQVFVEISAISSTCVIFGQLPALWTKVWTRV